MKHACILVATDCSTDADMVKNLLRVEFDNVQTSTEESLAVADFEAHRPEGLILAFNTLEKAERHYLKLFRQSALILGLTHRTLVLCDKDELQQAYALCRDGHFDDYMLFWPLIHDAPRLPMSVLLALRSLQPGVPPVNGLDSDAQIERIQPMILVVDDNEFDRKLVGKLLEEELYDIVYANSGIDALDLLRTTRPDLILMDMDMPQMSGLEALVRIRSNPRLAGLVVMMTTGHSEKAVVVQCLKAGAVDFSVKPLDRGSLLKKVSKYVRPD